MKHINYHTLKLYLSLSDSQHEILFFKLFDSSYFGYRAVTKRRGNDGFIKANLYTFQMSMRR